MKNLLLILLIIPILTLSQSKDVNKKEALIAFKNSDVRKKLKIPISQFKFTYKQIFDGEKHNYKKAIGFSNKNSKEFLNKVLFVYENWHGNDREIILTFSKQDLIKEYENFNKLP
ncbi:hypothetical protein [Epilithonimonas mollis]|uniref:Uncharacterized protein n=1 Tax=Epilithonimonas mollis TaxID=216903 RepID=A0A1M6U2H1_9FLAO|nr:hypothetical protein [Epilithonimonas mollis]SHK63278.1 hypothetical protein SAMN05444371_3077 [Epilithonimonas mollis]